MAVSFLGSQHWAQTAGVDLELGTKGRVGSSKGGGGVYEFGAGT